MAQAPIIPVVLCGGAGSRLWPLSGVNSSKPFLNFSGENSLLQETIVRALRVSGAPEQQLVVVTLDAMRNEVAAHISAWMHARILAEPCARNTAAAIAFAALYVRQEFGGDAVMWVLPADHVIGSEDALREAMFEAQQSAASNHLVTFGIQPTRPDTGYGYILRGEALAGGKTYAVSRFIEKPDVKTAQAYVDSGAYLWNSGMFVFRADDVLAELRLHAPQIMRTADDLESFAAAYGDMDDAPFDKAVMEKSTRASVVPCDARWSDVGSWGGLWDSCAKDAAGNVALGEGVFHESSNCLIHAKSGRKVVCIGVEDIVVIEAGDTVLVTDRRNADALKAFVGVQEGVSAKEATKR
jgi:mannose-1-phosphate guanylyltransferase / mannose-6-phosphate isomerase